MKLSVSSLPISDNSSSSHIMSNEMLQSRGNMNMRQFGVAHDILNPFYER